MSKEAMKLALEALNNSVDLVVEDAYNAEKLYGNYPTRQGKVGVLKVLAENHKEAIKALEEALAKQEQSLELVEWRDVDGTGIPEPVYRFKAKHYQDEGMCQACEWGQCTTKTGCVAISNPSPKQEQIEPVCRMRVGQDSVTWYDDKGNATMHVDSSNKVTTYPQPKQEQGEPVAWMHWLYGPVRLFMNKDEAMLELDRLNREYPVDKDARKIRPLVFGDATPQQRTWVGLTDVELADCMTWSIKETCQAIEAKLKEKNT